MHIIRASMACSFHCSSFYLTLSSVAGGDLCLVGCVFYPADSIDTDWVTTITLNGGVVDYTYSARTTHVIVKSMRHQCVHQASERDEITIVHSRCDARDGCAKSGTFLALVYFVLPKSVHWCCACGASRWRMCECRHRRLSALLST